jgi:hypothetical protein
VPDTGVLTWVLGSRAGDKVGARHCSLSHTHYLSVSLALSLSRSLPRSLSRSSRLIAGLRRSCIHTYIHTYIHTARKMRHVALEVTLFRRW